MIRVNLLPIREIKAEVGRRRDLTIAGAALGLTVVLLLGHYQYQSYQMSNLEKELAEVRKEIQVLNVKTKEVADLENKIKEFTAKNKVIEDLNKKKSGPVRVMESLSAATPPTLWLTEFRENGGSVLMTGLATDNQTVADFLKSLAGSAYFTNVELVETAQFDPKDGQGMKKFSVRSGVSYQSLMPANEGEGGPKSKSEGKKQ